MNSRIFYNIALIEGVILAMRKSIKVYLLNISTTPMVDINTRATRLHKIPEQKFCLCLRYLAYRSGNTNLTI